VGDLGGMSLADGAVRENERYIPIRATKGERMTQLFKTLMTVCLGALLFTSAGCEDKEAQEALKTCKNDLANEQKLATSQTGTINELKSQLAQAQAKVQELTKDNEAAKTGKNGKAMEEKGKAGEDKKAEDKEAKKADKADKKDKKAGKK
jgi:hypothetical protein